MNYEHHFKDMIESIPDYRKIVIIKFIIKYENKFLLEGGFLKSDFNSLNRKF